MHRSGLRKICKYIPTKIFPIVRKNKQIFHHYFQNFARKIDRNQKKI